MAGSIDPSRDRDILVEVRNLKKHFPVTKGAVFRRHVADVKAVDDVSFTIGKGEVLGLVGESGCGKTTVARCILKLVTPTDGTILFDGDDTDDLDKQGTIKFRRRVQAIFQDPYSSLNPRMKVRDIVGEPIYVHSKQPDSAAISGRFTSTASSQIQQPSRAVSASCSTSAACREVLPAAIPTR